MEQEPRLPPIHITKTEDGKADVVTSPVCDFCMDMYPSWLYGCENFHIDEIISQFGMGEAWGSWGEWCACDACAELIDEEDIVSLLERNRNPANAMRAEHAALIIQGFFDNMTGEKTPFG